MCDMNSFIIYIKLEHSQKTNKHNVKERYDASNYDVERPLPMRKKNVIGMMKHVMERTVMKQIIG